MALVKIVRNPPPNEPPEWAKILTTEPTQRSDLVVEASALTMSLLFFSIIFAAAVIIIQPFLLMFYKTVYPNLATVSFTSVGIAAGWLALITIFFISRKLIRGISRLLTFAILVLVILTTIYFFALVFQEFTHWLLYPDGLQRFIHAWQAFFQAIF